ncbi:MAG: ATP-binding cassette domain-containing protein, partial [Abditibacteriales bacterium]|nr:ATP-binding cassette domain-containing protein [Abditibacteriales bacterium]
MRFGGVEFVCRIEAASPGTADKPEACPTRVVALAPRLTVGRDATCDIVLDFPYVSRWHCQVRQTPQGYLLEDLQSTNGTFLNGVRVMQPALLAQGDVVQIGLSRLIFEDGFLVHHEQTGRVRLAAVGLRQEVRRRGQPISLLHNVTFAVEPQEFVAIVGASGAGKTTLLNALTGFRPAAQGSVRLNGVDFYQHIELFRAAIGWVPQEDIVHRELTVHRVLRYAARLRLPPDTEDAEIERLIDSVLDELELSHRKAAVVQTLSGGERKRVNVGVELLTRPSLLFLDEPTAGLDPGLERRFIALVKHLTREGRTILMVTHATDSIAECDMLLFLAPGGRLVFFGPPQEALSFFGVRDHADAYLRVTDDHPNGTDWEERYRGSVYYDRYVRQRLERSPNAPAPTTTRVLTALGASRPRASGWAQFKVLYQRYFDTLRGDPRNLAIMLGQAPVIALLLTLVFRPNLFAAEQRPDPHGVFPIQDAPKLLFLLVISALWFGTCNAAREITKERPLYCRERLVNL